MGLALLHPLKKNLIFFTGNGFIEGTELDGFLREFVTSVNASECGPEVYKSTISFYFPSSVLEFYNTCTLFIARW